MNLSCLRRLGATLATFLACSAVPAHAETESRKVSGFDAVLLELPGELRVTQGKRESLTLEAEPAVLRKIVTEVHEGRLRIGLAPGRIETRQPIRITLELRHLRALESRAAAAIVAGPLRADTLTLVLTSGGPVRFEQLDLRDLTVSMAGAGDVGVDSGRISTQRIAIAGVGRYVAPALACEQAEVAIQGNGQVRLAASSRLDVRISGVGQVRYRGEPAVTQSIQGVGTVEKD